MTGPSEDDRKLFTLSCLNKYDHDQGLPYYVNSCNQTASCGPNSFIILEKGLQLLWDPYHPRVCDVSSITLHQGVCKSC